MKTQIFLDHVKKCEFCSEKTFVFLPLKMTFSIDIYFQTLRMVGASVVSMLKLSLCRRSKNNKKSKSLSIMGYRVYTRCFGRSE